MARRAASSVVFYINGGALRPGNRKFAERRKPLFYLAYQYSPSNWDLFIPWRRNLTVFGKYYFLHQTVSFYQTFRIFAEFLPERLCCPANPAAALLFIAGRPFNVVGFFTLFVLYLNPGQQRAQHASIT